MLALTCSQPQVVRSKTSRDRHTFVIVFDVRQFRRPWHQPVSRKKKANKLCPNPSAILSELWILCLGGAALVLSLGNFSGCPSDYWRDRMSSPDLIPVNFSALCKKVKKAQPRARKRRKLIFKPYPMWRKLIFKPYPMWRNLILKPYPILYFSSSFSHFKSVHIDFRLILTFI